jgi:DNA-directed RNA polymerase subunit H (RpoH/RPB5)
MTSPDEIYTLFIVKRTQVEMMADRGYPLPEAEIELFIENDDAAHPTDELLTSFIKQYTNTSGIFSREDMSELYTKDDEQTYVYFVPPTNKDKQGVGVVTTFIEKINDIGVDRGIIITDDPFTPDATKALAALTKPLIQVFFDYQLYTNPTYHVIVPKQERLTPEERTAFLTKSKIQPRQLLVSSIDDPIVRYYGWNVNDIIRVHRFNISSSKTMVRSSIAYRIITSRRFDDDNKKKAVKVTS